MTVTAIVDGVHLAPETAKSAWLAARDRFCLISDAIAAAGAGEGTFRMGELEVHVADGACRLADGTLAGSVLTMDRAVRELVALGVPLAHAVAAATTAPARLIGRPELGTLTPGTPADVVVLDDALQVTHTIVQGAALKIRQSGGCLAAGRPGGSARARPPRHHPRRPGRWGRAASAASERLAVVQFAGPIEGTWHDALRGSGVRIVWYEPQFAYLVRGTDAPASRAAERPGVRELRPYAAADKVVGDPGGTVAVSMLTGTDGATARADVGRSDAARFSADGVSTRYAQLSPPEPSTVARDPGGRDHAGIRCRACSTSGPGQIVLGQLDGAFQPILGTGYLDALSQLGVGASDPSFVVDVGDTGLDTGALQVAHSDFRANGDPAGASRVAYVHDETGDRPRATATAHGTHVASTVAGYNSGTGASGSRMPRASTTGSVIAPRARIGCDRMFDCHGFLDVSHLVRRDRVRRLRGRRPDLEQLLGRAVRRAYNADAREYDALVRDAQPSRPREPADRRGLLRRQRRPPSQASTATDRSAAPGRRRT